MKIRNILLLLVMLLSAQLQAQVWETDFEDAAERAKWVLNKTATQNRYENLDHKWYFGEAGNHTPDGHYGLFVSTDGKTADYSAEKSQVITAYRKICLPKGEYVIYFDWRGQATLGDGFVVGLVDTTTNMNSSGSYFTEWQQTIRKNDTIYSHSPSWARGRSVIQSTGDTCSLVFAWFSTGTGSSAPPSGCIDNIEIYLKEQECEMPTYIHHSITTAALVVTWLGNAEKYEVRAYDAQAKQWQIFPNLRTKKVSIPNLSEGMNTIYIRSICGENKSNYVVYNVLVYHKGERCIEYMELNTKTCASYSGSSTASPSSTGLVNPDYADYNHPTALHTLHYVPDEYDPNLTETSGRLLTKPKDALASVRIGRVNDTFVARSVYTYKVPESDKAILKLRYAVVLPNPHPDDTSINPKFTIDIKHNNRPLPNNCGQASFIAGNDMTGWKSCKIQGQDGYWKDWTEVAVNLRDYVGETITITLTITGCGLSEHGAYAYFTLDCESGELYGQECGVDNPTKEFIAPSGFDYFWYETNPETGDPIEKGREQVFNVAPDDTITYHVDIISKTNSQCYYTLDACGIPRFPVAQATAKPVYTDCDVTVEFENKSYVWFQYMAEVMENKKDSMFHHEDRVEEVIWDFGDGTSPVMNNAAVVHHTYPDTGGTYMVTVTARDGECDSTISFSITLDDLFLTQHVHISVGSTLEVGSNMYTYYEPGVFTETYIVPNGCEKTDIVHVYEKDFPIKDSICEGGEYDFFGQKLTKSGKYSHTLKKTILGAEHLDSIIILDLHVEPMVKLAVSDTIVLCADDGVLYIPYTHLQGKLDTMHVAFQDSTYAFAVGDSILIPFSEDIQPNDYPVVIQLATEECPAEDIHLCAQVQYASSIIEVKHGIIALYNEEFNEGYTFTTYQWYRNGEPIEGATDSYIKVTSDDVGATYTVVVTREEDGIVMATCPIEYYETTDVPTLQAPFATIYPTTLTHGETLFINGVENIAIYDVTGKVIMPRTDITSPYTLTCDMQPGLYFVHTNTQIIKIIVN